MISGTLNSIRQERAELARDVECIRESVQEDYVEERLMDIAMDDFDPDENLYEESSRSVDMIPTDERYVTEEVDRILNSDHNLSFDEMIGIPDDDIED